MQIESSGSAELIEFCTKMANTQSLYYRLHSKRRIYMRSRPLEKRSHKLWVTCSSSQVNYGQVLALGKCTESIWMDYGRFIGNFDSESILNQPKFIKTIASAYQANGDSGHCGFQFHRPLSALLIFRRLNQRLEVGTLQFRGFIERSFDSFNSFNSLNS